MTTPSHPVPANSSNGFPPHYEAKASMYSKQALLSMEQNGIKPTPENYAVWFHYAMAQNRDLVKEIETILRNRVPFSSYTSNYLYNKYVIPDKNQKILEDSTTGANRILGEVLKAVNEFGTKTETYNADVDTYIAKMPVDIPDPTVQALVKDLISATSEIKTRGETLNLQMQESKQEIEHLRKNLEQVTTESQRDFLTGVYNRKAMDRMLEERIASAKAENTELCLLMIDIDHFKQFNDKFGHLLGDEVLKIVARAMMDCVRGKDVVARYGGEEFAVILPMTPMAGALKVAETIRTTIASRELKRKDTGEVYGVITVSIGISQFRHESDNVAAFIKRADDALYLSKRSGRNRATPEIS